MGIEKKGKYIRMSDDVENLLTAIAKVKNQTQTQVIETAIRDVSGNILLGYGSPLQIGSSTGSREIVFYSGQGAPAFSINSLIFIFIFSSNEANPILTLSIYSFSEVSLKNLIFSFILLNALFIPCSPTKFG